MNALISSMDTVPSLSASMTSKFSATLDIASLTDNLIAQGVAAEHLTRVITALNDGVSQRVLEQLQSEFVLGQEA